MTTPTPKPRRASPLRIVLGLLLVAGLATWGGFGGRAYLRVVRDQAALAKVAAQRPAALLALRADEDARLRAGPVPIEEAMRTLALKGRMGLGSALVPQPSIDTAPLMGWAFQPHDVPDWMLAPPPPPATSAAPGASSAPRPR